MSSHVPIEETVLFRKFEDIAGTVWNLVSDWKPFAQQTIGKQLVRAIDSVGANLVEGDGRYGSADALHFFVIARGSARESQLWIRRAIERRLINQIEGSRLLELIDHALRSLNSLITFRRNKANIVRETTQAYDVGSAQHFAEEHLYGEGSTEIRGLHGESPPEY